MNRSTAIALVFSLLAAIISTDASAAKFKICNKEKNKDDVYVVAVLARSMVFFKERWESTGWIWIKPGNCEQVGEFNSNTLYLLSVNRLTDNGRKVLDYGVKQIPKTHWDSGSYGMEDFFCVSEEPYGRKADNKAAFRRCRSDEYKQLFNLHVFVEHNDNFTLSLK